MQTIERAQADPELVTSLLSSRSNSEAVVAFTLLRGALTERELLMLANLREIIHEMPSETFRTGESLEILERAADYEFTGYSYRRAFESSLGVFGVEFLGTTNSCEGIVVHTPSGRHALIGSDSDTIDSMLVPLLVHHSILLDAVLEALELLGSPLDPDIYLTADDFIAEHSAGTARDVFTELF